MHCLVYPLQLTEACRLGDVIMHAPTFQTESYVQKYEQWCLRKSQDLTRACMILNTIAN